MIAEGNNEMFQSYSDYIMEDFYSQKSVSDIIATHLKMLMLSFEKFDLKFIIQASEYDRRSPH